MGSVTIGANSYDIYGTTSGADDYLAARIGATEWASATATTQAQALVTGTRQIEAYLTKLGLTADPSASVDTEIEQANYELAYALVVDSTIQDSTNFGLNEKRYKAGSVELEYFSPQKGGRFPSIVQTLLNNWIAAQGGGGSSVGLASGTDEVSSLDAADFGISEAY